MSLLTRFRAWRTRRRHAAHRRWLRKNKVLPAPWAGSIVHNIKEPNTWR